MGKKSRKGQSRANNNNNNRKKINGQRTNNNNKRNNNNNDDGVPNTTVVEETTVNEILVEDTTTAGIPVEEQSVKKEEEKAVVAEEESSLPNGLELSLSILSAAQQELAKKLCAPPCNQSHLFEHWTTPSEIQSPSSKAVDDVKRNFMAQLESMDNAYPNGGLAQYVANGQDLLAKSQKGENPLDGWKPSVPQGETLELGTEKFDNFEQLGLAEVGQCGFVLVAGGLGERLGYGDIKIGLPTEMATETCYIQFYIETILAFQSKFSKPNQKLPLCIMTSNDTNAKTVKLLEEKNYFGMDKEQITIVQQGQGVPALTDNDAHLALDTNDRYKLQAKPHGHGDIHALLHSENVAHTWLKNGVSWVVFFQDTNGLAFHTLPVALGVSKQLNLIMNSIAVPRKAKQAVGGICKLTNEEKGEERTINVEYNQLDPLLRASGFPDGDVNDEKTGFSPYPGNINQLVFELGSYCKVLERTEGAMPEFVNPKYKDAEKTIFKKPTRLECMMQDFPTVLEGDEVKQVGFTSVAANMCFSPVKNATSDGIALQTKGTHPGVAASGEADQYAAVRKIMTTIGCKVEDSPTTKFAGIEVKPGPAIVFGPTFVTYPGEYKTKFPNPSKVKISAGSSLVVNGNGVVIESLELDGALVIECEDGVSGVIKDLVVKNKGWQKVEEEGSDMEVIRMRGYRLEKTETKTILFKKDGSVEGLGSPEPPPKSTPKSASSPKAISTTPVKEVIKPGASTPQSLTDPSGTETSEVTNECCIIL